MRKFIYIVFLTLILASIFIIIVSYCNNEWSTITASISLIITVISGWIAYEVFYRQAQADRPQIVLRLDYNSRYSLVLLIAENLGAKPAFNIKFNWYRELINHKGNPVKFNKFDNIIDIPVLNPKEATSVIIDKPSVLFNRCKKEENFEFSGEVSYQEILKSKKRISYPFLFSISHYGNSPSFENEEPKTMYELQKIPKILEKIKDELKKKNEKPEQ